MFNEEFLPGDKRQLYSIFFNHQRTGYVAETVELATEYAINILEEKEGFIDTIKTDSEPVSVGDLVAKGKLGKVDIDIILEEWNVCENGGLDLDGMPYMEKYH